MAEPDATRAELITTHAGPVTKDQIDELGHMNVRFYGQRALAGTAAMAERLGLGEPRPARTYTRHHAEQLLGASLTVSSALLAGTDRLRLYHELRNVDTDALAATFVHDLDRPAVEAPMIELPDHGRPRSIDLGLDTLAAAPPLSRMRELGLATRYPRQVDAEDTAGETTVAVWNAPNLVWSGEPIEGSHDWLHTTDDGITMGWATMEARLQIGRLPGLGTPIQSFGATVAIGDKTTHDLYWSYDLDSGDPLVSFEAVNLAFDIDARRAISIPAELEVSRRLHPELLPAPPA